MSRSASGQRADHGRRQSRSRSWRGCGPCPARPPEVGRRDRRASRADARPPLPWPRHAAERDLPGRRRCGGEGVDLDDTAPSAWRWRIAHRRSAAIDERDAAGDAGGGERHAPVPAEVALRLAQHVAVGDRAVAGAVGDGIRLDAWRARSPRRVGGAAAVISMRFSPATTAPVTSARCAGRKAESRRAEPRLPFSAHLGHRCRGIVDDR